MPAKSTYGCELPLGDLLPATKYVIKIQTCVTNHNREILKSAVQELTVWTNPSSPKEFKQTNSRKDKKREPTSVKLRWKAPDEDIDRFEVAYDAHGVGRQLGKVEGSRRSAKISALEPGTKYNCSISAVLRNGQRSHIVKCVAYTAPATPSNIVEIVANTNGIYLQWMPAAGDVQKYIIQYRSIQGMDPDNQEGHKDDTSPKALLAQDGDCDESHSDEDQETVDQDEELNPWDKRYDKIENIRSQCNLEKLEAGTKYEIRIFATSYSYPSPPLRVIQATKPGKPGEVTKKESDSTAGSISLSWVPSDGHVSGYEIEYGREDRSTRQPLTSDSPNCIIDNITPGMPYSYVVYTISNGMRGDPSQFVASTDLPCPENFEVNKASTRSLHLKWDSPPSFADGSWSYTVKYRQYGCSDSFGNDREVRTENLEVTGLVPGRQYEFSVQITGWKDAVGHSTSKEVFCTGTTVPESVHNLRFDPCANTLYWDKPDGDIEEYEIEEKVAEVTEKFVSNACKHHLQTVKRGEKYTFSVVAISNGKRSKEVSHSETLAPGSPKFKKQSTIVTTSTINLEWGAPGGTVKHYEIFYQPEDEDVGFLSSWWSGGEKKETANHCHHTLDNLNPGMKYRCKVFAIVDGARDEHGDQMLVATKPDKPTVESDLSTDKLILKSTCKGRKDCYEICYKFQDDMEWKTEFFESSPKYEKEKVELLKWQKGCIYEVEVKCISYYDTDIKVKSDPVRMKIHTEPSKPEVTDSVTTTELQLEWNQITEVGVNKIVVYWQVSNQQQRKKREITNIASTSCSIDELTPGTQYHAEVLFYCGDKSSSSGKIEFRTDPVPPLEIYETDVSHSTANIEWNIPKGQCDRIIAQLTKLSTNESSDLLVRHGSHDIKLTSLTPATQYCLTVWSKSGEKKSKPQSFDFSTAPLSPKNLCANAAARSASLSWTYPNKHSNDDINFEIKYWEQTSRDIQFKTEYSEAEKKTIESLKPGSSYKVQVWSVFNGRKSKDYCEGVINTDPLSVNDFHVEAYLTYADVSWNPPSEGRVKRYDIEYAPVSNPRNKSKVSVQHPTCKGSIINLNSGTKYFVKVVSIVEGRESQSADKKCFYTVPSPPPKISPEITSHSVTVKWSRNEQEPDVTEAKVTYKLQGMPEWQTMHVPTTGPQELLIDNLRPQMRVEGFVELVCGDKTSTETKWSATTDSIRVGQICVSDVTKTTSHLSWADQHNFDGIRYIVYYKENLPEAIRWTQRIPVVPYIDLTDLKTGTEYEVTVAVEVNGAESNDKSRTEFTTRPSEPSKLELMKPAAVDSACIQWRPAPGNLDHYLLEYTSENGSSKNDTISNGKSTAVLPDLLPGTQYTVTLCAVRKGSESEKCQFEFMTVPATPLVSVHSEHTSITLSWTHKGEADNFNLTCHKEGDNDEPLKVDISCQESDYTIEGLSENTKYSGQIWAVRGSERSEASDWMCVTALRKTTDASPMATTGRANLRDTAGRIFLDLKLEKFGSQAAGGAEGGMAYTISLRVLVKCARGYLNINKTRNFDSYCKGVIYPRRDKDPQKTKTVRGDDPTWNEEMTFVFRSINEMRNRCLQVSIVEYISLSLKKDAKIGGVRLNMGTGKYMESSVNWMDSTPQEKAVWESLLESTPGTIISCDLPLRDLKI